MYQLVHPANVEEYWHMVAPWIAQAIGESDAWYDLEAIKKGAKEGLCRLWIGRDQNQEIDLVLVTETWYMDGRKVLVLRWLCGKNMHEWLEDFHLVEGWAMSNGFQDIHIWGRPGFSKICKPLGFRHEFTVLSKPLIRGLN